MRVSSELLFETLNPAGTFSTAIGGTSAWSASSAPDGNATMFDTEAVWTLRDAVNREVFQVVQFKARFGNAAGFYIQSEIPLVPGPTYETLEYDTNPDNQSGDLVSSYLDYDYDAFGAYLVAATSGSGEVDESSGNDTIVSTGGVGLVFGGAGADSSSGERATICFLGKGPRQIRSRCLIPTSIPIATTGRRPEQAPPSPARQAITRWFSMPAIRAPVARQCRRSSRILAAATNRRSRPSNAI